MQLLARTILDVLRKPCGATVSDEGDGLCGKHIPWVCIFDYLIEPSTPMFHSLVLLILLNSQNLMHVAAWISCLLLCTEK